VTASLSVTGNVLSWQIQNVDFQFPDTPEPLVAIFGFNTTLVLNLALNALRGKNDN